MRREESVCTCLRCREVGRVRQEDPHIISATTAMFDDVFEASNGEEHFISIEDGRRRAVFAFCRLRLPPKAPSSDDTAAMHGMMPELRGSAFVRELHTYGNLVPIDGADADAAQHKGYGRRLMAEAERIAKNDGYRRLVVIAGVGVRAYYRKLGYRLRGTYMVKDLR
jgi:elongator complex protein 3